MNLSEMNEELKRHGLTLSQFRKRMKKRKAELNEMTITEFTEQIKKISKELKDPRSPVRIIDEKGEYRHVELQCFFGVLVIRIGQPIYEKRKVKEPLPSDTCFPSGEPK